MVAVFAFNDTRRLRDGKYVLHKRSAPACKGNDRGDYLLDLVLSNFASGLTVKVVPGIHDNDHCAVIVGIQIHIPASNPARRSVLDFRAASWNESRVELRK